MFPTGFPAPQFCCSILCQEILLLWDKNESLTNPFAPRVEGLLLLVHRNVIFLLPLRSAIAYLWCTLQEPIQLPYGPYAQGLPPMETREQRRQSCWCVLDLIKMWDGMQPEGTARPGNLEALPGSRIQLELYCLKGKNYPTDSRKHLYRKSEDKQNEVCECKHFPALPAAFQQPRRGHREQWTLYPVSKS